MKLRYLIPTAIALSALVMTGCAHDAERATVTEEDFQVPRDTLTTVGTEGGAVDPEARDHIIQADEHIDNAIMYTNMNKPEVAQLELYRAEVDAEVALSYTREESTQDRVLEIKQRVRRLSDATDAGDDLSMR